MFLAFVALRLAVSVLAKRLTGKNVSKVTYFVSSGTLNQNSDQPLLTSILNVVYNNNNNNTTFV